MAGRRETRHKTATERRALPSQSIRMGLTGAPLLVLTSLRTRIGRAHEGEIGSLASSLTHEPLPCITWKRTATRKMSGSSSIPAFLVALLNLKTHHPVKEFSLSRSYWQRAMGRRTGQRLVERDSLDRAQQTSYHGNERIGGW